uniref:Uncharacterized protein n=1 Tax=Anopheles culicifacies TaxID=139723 RepID=A0A182MQ51_9DIPT
MERGASTIASGPNASRCTIQLPLGGRFATDFTHRRGRLHTNHDTNHWDARIRTVRMGREHDAHLSERIWRLVEWWINSGVYGEARQNYVLLWSPFFQQGVRMSRCKPSKTISFPTPTRYEWSKTYLARPKDNLIAHRDSLLKQPFRPSYDKDGDPTMDCLLDWSYARIWQTEAQDFRHNRTLTERSKSAKKQYPIYSDRKLKTAEPPKERYTMKRFQNVPAKVDTGVRGVPLRPLRTC